LGTKISLEPAFSLQCEFLFRCRLAPGEYTIEFGLVDIRGHEAHSKAVSSTGVSGEYYEVLCYPPPVGRFVVVAQGIDPIARSGHFGIVDIDAQTRFKTSRGRSC
jgi:hypothetical protein